MRRRLRRMTVMLGCAVAWQRDDRGITAALRQIVANKAVILVPRRERSLWILHRISPTLTQTIARVLARKIQRDLLDNSAPSQ